MNKDSKIYDGGVLDKELIEEHSKSSSYQYPFARLEYWEFRNLMDAWMDNDISRDKYSFLFKLLDREAKVRGYKGFIEAYHDYSE